jgi:hypothetical protein
MARPRIEMTELADSAIGAVAAQRRGACERRRATALGHGRRPGKDDVSFTLPLEGETRLRCPHAAPRLFSRAFSSVPALRLASTSRSGAECQSASELKSDLESESASPGTRK